jgi:hypothetical protein
MLWEEQTRDPPAIVKKPATTTTSHQVTLDSSPTNAEDHLIAHTIKANIHNASKLSGPLPRHANALPRPARSTNTAFRGCPPTYHCSPLSCNAARPDCLQPKLHEANARRPRPPHHIRGRRPDIPSNHPHQDVLTEPATLQP